MKSSRRISPGWTGGTNTSGLLIFTAPFLMIIDDFHIVAMAITPNKTDSPLIIDPNRVLSFPITSLSYVGPYTPSFASMNILVVEDEPELASVLMRGLEEECFCVQLCAEGHAALRRSDEVKFDLILLDVMLPDISGFDVVQQLRERSRETPVLMLTARDALADIVRGLDSGADDYLTKPFSFLELLSRIRAFERRSGDKPRNVLESGDLVLDVAAQRAFRKGHPLHLSLTEFRLLEVLARHKGQVLQTSSLTGGMV
jgi:DNA-binding response OmpR family regulator